MAKKKKEKRTGTFITVLVMLLVTTAAVLFAICNAALSTGFFTANYTFSSLLQSIFDRDTAADKALFTMINHEDPRYPDVYSAFRTAAFRNLFYMTAFLVAALLVYVLITLIYRWAESVSAKRKPPQKEQSRPQQQVYQNPAPAAQPYQPVSPYAPPQGYNAGYTPGYNTGYAPGGYVPPTPMPQNTAAAPPPAAAPSAPETVASGASGSRGAKTMKLRRDAIAERAAAAAVPPEPVQPEPEVTGIAAFLRNAAIIVYTDIKENGKTVRYFMASTVPDTECREFQNDKVRQFMQFSRRNAVFIAGDGSGRLRTDLRLPKNLRLQYSEEDEVFQLACGERAISSDDTAAVQSVDLVHYDENEAYREKYVRDVTMYERDYHVEIAY